MLRIILTLIAGISGFAVSFLFGGCGKSPCCTRTDSDLRNPLNQLWTEGGWETNPRKTSIEKLIIAELPLGSSTNEVVKHIQRHFSKFDHVVYYPMYTSNERYYNVVACGQQNGATWATLSVLYWFSSGKLTRVEVNGYAAGL